MKGIFHPDIFHNWEDAYFSKQKLKELDPEEDKYLLNYLHLQYLSLYQDELRRERLMKKLGICGPPRKMENLEDPSDNLYEEYFVLREQVAREPDAEVLKEAVYETSGQMAIFAFCYLTKYFYPSPECDAYSYRTYDCGWKEGMTTEEVIDFCQEIIDVNGPFVREAKECLENPPKDHKDYDGERMVSRERAASEPPYIRKERRAPFKNSGEYNRERAEILRLEKLGQEALRSGDRENASIHFFNMHILAKKTGKYTQRWEVLDDYARSGTELAQAAESYDTAEEAAFVLKYILQHNPEEKTYREHLKEAESVYRKLVGIYDAENNTPIIFCHSFPPAEEEAICRLLSERFRDRGCSREISFRRMDTDDPWLWEGNINCCDMSLMAKMYDFMYKPALSPFIDTDRVFPALLEQGRIEEIQFGLPFLVFEGKTHFAFIGNNLCGKKYVDCLDLMQLMADSNLIYDICMAGSRPARMFPADRIACSRLAVQDPVFEAFSRKFTVNNRN